MPVPSDISASVSAPRRLGSSDRPAILNHLLRLSDGDRQMRFCHVLNDDGVRSYAEQINLERDICIGIFDRQDNLVALVQGFVYEEYGVRLMEAAFSTDEAMRRRGLGTLLFAEITDCALAEGVDRVIAQCLAGNRPMRMLLLAAGATCEVEDGEVIGHLYPTTKVRT
jgi:GNAT superfamily N-acetyltransferase